VLVGELLRLGFGLRAEFFVVFSSPGFSRIRLGERLDTRIVRRQRGVRVVLQHACGFERPADIVRGGLLGFGEHGGDLRLHA
jgi:hypothetical protein